MRVVEQTREKISRRLVVLAEKVDRMMLQRLAVNTRVVRRVEEGLVDRGVTRAVKRLSSRRCSKFVARGRGVCRQVYRRRLQTAAGFGGWRKL